MLDDVATSCTSTRDQALIVEATPTTRATSKEQTLSEERANAVVAYLAANLALKATDADRITASATPRRSASRPTRFACS